MAEFERRIRHFVRFETEELAGRDPQAALLRRAAKARLFLLDPGGTQLDSPQFAAWLERQLAVPSTELLLAVGGADGFESAVHARADGRISLSPLTFSHALARLVLFEQLYRALATLNHHPYAH